MATISAYSSHELVQSGTSVSIIAPGGVLQESIVAIDLAGGQLTRIITIGMDVSIASGQAIRLLGLKSESASTTIVAVKDGAASPAIRAILAAGALSSAETVDFMGVAFPLGASINIEAGGAPVLVFWRYM